ncbi:MAG: hypothetical protein R3F20_09150 [Planctomycetota bacterium]
MRWLIVSETDGEGVYVFGRRSEVDGPCEFDHWFSSVADAKSFCADLGVEAGAWVDIGDPLPQCQHDWVSPVRAVLRGDGARRHQQFERLTEGGWCPVEPNDPSLLIATLVQDGGRG